MILIQSAITKMHSLRLEIRGDLNDETVLVSSSKSYKIRQADSSNTILITSANHNNAENEENTDSNQMNMDCNESIYSAISCVYTLTQQPPKLNKLHRILYQRPYS